MNRKISNRKTRNAFALFCGSLFFVCALLNASAASAIEGIRYLYINVQINSDGSANVSQTTTIGFNPQDYDGTISVLPLANQYDDTNSKFKIGQINITNKDHIPVKFKTKKSGNSILAKLSQNDKIDTSELTLSYKIKNAIRKQGDKSIFVFSPIRSNWPFPINQAIITVKLPSDLEEKDLGANCQMVKTGNKIDCLSKRNIFNPLNRIDGIVLIAEDIGKPDTLSISVAVPKNIIHRSLINGNISWWLTINGLWVIIGLSIWGLSRSPKRKWYKKLWWWKYIKKRWLKIK